MSFSKNSIIEKIKKCLALSNSSNSHEAALAIERAHAMMEKYNITRTDVAMSDISAHKTSAGRNLNAPQYVDLLVGVIKKTFGCDAVFIPVPGWDYYKNSVEFIGFDPNPEIAAYAFAVLLRQLERGRRSYLKGLSKRMKRKNKTIRAANWAEGWVVAVSRKVKAMAINDSDRALLDKWIAKRFSDLEESKPKHVPSGGQHGLKAFCDGISDGSQVQLHRAMNGGKEQEYLK